MLRDLAPHLSVLDRARGSLLGLATGDALGAAVEFLAPGSFEPVTGMRGGGALGLAAGEWTDDTSMALCLAESLVTCGRFDARDQMERYLRWYRHGHLSSTGQCVDIGGTVRDALERYEKTGEPFSGNADPKSAGNGSLMRLAPVVVWHAADPAEAIQQAAASSRTTHGAATSVDACRYFAGLLLGAFDGVPKDLLLSPLWSPAPEVFDAEPLTPAIAAVASGSFRERTPPEIRGRGYVVESLEAVLWAFACTDTFADGALAAVNLGDDADTTAAIYGQLAGAYYGTAAIPAEWRMRLAKRALVEELAERLVIERPRSAR
ncbi:MAG: ADP-ribosylglycohydrolase family protein [Gemmatimonadota bacterium]|nr:ADP-ribosylglycohydrolase family protein [Gemmatimonadota bacterium]